MIDNILLKEYELYGWKPDKTLSADENMMDLVMLVTRNSHCKQGSMACVLVQTDKSIITVATNRPLFTENDSDVHAEIAALGAACQTGRKTGNATAYITMPPCKRCFAALVVAGVKRIVTRRILPKTITDCAKKENIALISLSKEMMEMQTARLNTLIYGDPSGKKRIRPESEETESKKASKVAESDN